MNNDVDCLRYGKRRNSFWDDPVGDLLKYLCEPRQWADRFLAIAHNAKAFDLHFILNRAMLSKWRPELITNSIKIICIKMEQLVFLDSVSFLTCALRKLPKSLGLEACANFPRL